MIMNSGKRREHDYWQYMDTCTYLKKIDSFVEQSLECLTGM